MKRLFAIFAFATMFVLVASFTANAAANTNSHKEATGTFMYTVEPPLVINTITGSQDLGAVCPNCTVNFSTPKCLEFQVTGGASCNVAVSFPMTTAPEAGVTIATTREYNDQYGSNPSSFEPFAVGGDGHISGSGNTAVGIWHIGSNDLRYRVCATSISADNTAAATTTGTSVWTLIADYTNSLAPHM